MRDYRKTKHVIHKLYLCACRLWYVLKYYENINIFARLFPLVGGGGGGVPLASSMTLLSGLSIVNDDQDFLNIHLSTSPTLNHSVKNGSDDDDNDEKNSVITEIEEPNNKILSSLRKNSSPTTFSALKSALFNGTSAKLNKNPLTPFFYISH